MRSWLPTAIFRDCRRRRGEGFTRSASAPADVHTHALFPTESQSFLGGRVTAMRRAGESYSDVIFQLVELEAVAANKLWSESALPVPHPAGRWRGAYPR